MSDLSRLLDDVYGDLGTTSATPPVTPPADDADGADGTAWGGGDDGNDAFAAWADDHGARLDGDDEDPTRAVDALPPSGAPTGARFLSELGSRTAEVTGEVPVVAAPTWRRADDDILPEGRARSGRRRRSRGTAPASPATTSSIEDFAADGSALDALAALEVPPPVPAEHPSADGGADATPTARRRSFRRR